MTGMVQIKNVCDVARTANSDAWIQDPEVLAAHRSQEPVLRSDLCDSVVDYGPEQSGPLLCAPYLPKRQRTGALRNLAEARSRFIETEGSLRDLTRFYIWRCVKLRQIARSCV
jgi:hypothetical protein